MTSRHRSTDRQLDSTFYCLGANNTFVFTSYTNTILLIVDDVQYNDLPNFDDPDQTDSVGIPIKTKHIEVHMRCDFYEWINGPCGFIAAITCDKTDPGCNQALTKSSVNWTCGMFNDDGTVIDDYDDTFECFQGGSDVYRGDYPVVSGMNAAAEWIWNESTWYTYSSYVSCKYDFAQSA